MPIDFGTHHRLNSSGLVHASNTRRAGPLMVRVTTSSRSDFRSTVVRFFMGVGSLSLLASIDLLLPFQFLDDLVQRVEACVPELAVPRDPRRLILQPARPQLAGPYATDLLRAHETGLLQDADVLLGRKSSRRLSPGSISQLAPAIADGWIPGTRPGMTIHCLRRAISFARYGVDIDSGARPAAENMPSRSSTA